MTWNWEHPDRPEFHYDANAIAPQENQFLLQSGTFIGLYAHIGADDREALRIELISDEAVKTSAIEGEIARPCIGAILAAPPARSWPGEAERKTRRTRHLDDDARALSGFRKTA